MEGLEGSLISVNIDQSRPMVCLAYSLLPPTYPLVDMAFHAKHFDKPYVNTSINEFVTHISDPNVIRVSLGFPLPQYVYATFAI